MPKSVYCKCKNKYLVEWLCKCDKQPYYWKQGIGITEGVVEVLVGVFDDTFDSTFN